MSKKRSFNPLTRACGAGVAALLLTAPAAYALNDVAGHLTLVNDNGAWSWFEDERAIVDPATGNVLVGTIADISGTGGAARDGAVEVAHFNLNTRRVSRVQLGTLPADDHNTPAFMVRPDGRYLAMYAGHNSDSLTRWRISTKPGDASSWQPQQTFTNAAGATYNNVFRLSSEGKTYNFTRTLNFDPNYQISTNDGSSWSYGGRLLRDPANSTSGRPYLKYASNHTDKIHFITTEGHPRDYNNGIYHGYIQNSMMYRSDGTLVGNLGAEPIANVFTPVMPQNMSLGGATRTHGWTTDLALGSDGTPYALFTSRVDSNPADHRLYYGRWSGAGWQVNELGKMGAGLYASEGDYTGLGAIDPRNPNTVYISSNTEPGSNIPLSKREIYKGVTGDGGATWSWTAITRHSTVDNIRPVVPQWNAGSAVFWMRGTYTSYTNYNTGIVGLIEQDNEAVGKIRFTDATPLNTTRADGAPITFTGPDSSMTGPNDGNWHRYSGRGLGGEVLSLVDENNDATGTRIRTTATNVAAGTYDVFAYFKTESAYDIAVLAGLSEDGMRLFRRDQTEEIDVDELHSLPPMSDFLFDIHKAYLGRLTLTETGSVSVFVEDALVPGTLASATMFDGFGLAPVTVVPEPSSAVGVLAAAGSLLLARRRRSRMR